MYIHARIQTSNLSHVTWVSKLGSPVATATPKNVLDGWNPIGMLVVLLWHTKIDDTQQYLVSLKQS